MSNLCFDFNLLLKEAIGNHGLSENELIEAFNENRATILEFLSDIKENKIGFASILDDEEVIRQIQNFSLRIKNKFRHIVILGIGGSSLGPLMVLNALKAPFYNLHPQNKRFYFIDNVDPTTISELLNVIDLPQTLFVAISKSGKTIETSASLLYFLNIAKNKNLKLEEHFVVVTDPMEGPFRELANKYNLQSFEIPANVGGRYSLFTPVGLLPAILFDIDISKLVIGARQMRDTILSDNLFENPIKNPLLLTAISIYLLNKKGFDNLVFFPYGDSLSLFADWSIQLWAESLGKKFNVENKEVFFGHTPLKAVGARDQHSQLQLFMEGPLDKIFLFLSVANPTQDIYVENCINDIDEFKELNGLSFNKLLLSEKRAVELSLAKEERPSLSIELASINELAIGKLACFLELLTALMGYIWKINPFDQPGVELGKKYTKALLGLHHFDYLLSDINAIEKNKKMSIIEV